MEPTFRDMLDPARVSARLSSNTKEGVIGELARLLTVDAPGLDSEAVRRVLLDRERLASTGVGSGVAIPHGRVRGLTGVRIAVALHREGVHFDAIDGGPVHIFVGVLASDREPNLHLKVLARASRLLRDPAVRATLQSIDEATTLYETFVGEDERRAG